MGNLLMPKATAVWLIENTSLTFEQIANFCGLHPLEIQSIADGDVAKGIKGVDPVAGGQLKRQEIERCEADPTAQLTISSEITKYLSTNKSSTRSAKYIPVARRQDKPNGIAWLLKNCPEMKATQIAKLLGSTKNTVESIQNRTHWNSANLKPKDPVLLGLCSQTDLDRIYQAAKKKFEKEGGSKQNTSSSSTNIDDVFSLS